MKKKLVAIIFGGKGQEHTVSRMSARSVISLIDREKFIPYPILIDRRGAWREVSTRGRIVHPVRTPKGGAFICGEDKILPYSAFPVLHGDFGEDGRIQGLLETIGMPFVGCPATAGAVASDKILTKEIASSLGIPTAHAIHLTKATDPREARRLAEEEIGYPMLIKPAGLGSSVGCTLVTSPVEFDGAYSSAATFGERVLIEEYLEGVRELECAYLSSPLRGELFTRPGEVSLRGVYTYAAKYERTASAVIHPRADVSDAIARKIRDYSAALVSTLGIRQIARIDFFLHSGRLILNEINTMPGFTKGSLYPRMLTECGISPSQLVSELIEGSRC